MANVGFLELYHSAGQDLSELELYYEKEMEAYRAADYIISPHDLMTEFFCTHVYDTRKVVTARLGCYPSSKIATYSRKPRIVYAGSYGQIQDPFLLSLLTQKPPARIDCYGPKDPNYRFLPTMLNYKGCSETVDFLADYQFGLITVSRDRLREYSPATKFPYYFAHGLPVLFPEWMREGHLYEAAIPFSEDNFVDQVSRVAGDEALWRRLSTRAQEIASDLSWDKVLRPLSRLLVPQSASDLDVVGDNAAASARVADRRATRARVKESNAARQI
jgi:hypothetical protein